MLGTFGMEELEIRVGLLELGSQVTEEFSKQTINQLIDILKRLERIDERLKEFESRGQLCL